MHDHDELDEAQNTLHLGWKTETPPPIESSIDPAVTDDWTPVPRDPSKDTADPLATRQPESDETLIGGDSARGAGGDVNQKSRTIGPYKLLQQIGEGGMGSVWMAEQSEPVRRLVALKVIKAGLDNKQIVARFEAERQAVAMMNRCSNR